MSAAALDGRTEIERERERLRREARLMVCMKMEWDGIGFDACIPSG